MKRTTAYIPMMLFCCFWLSCNTPSLLPTVRVGSKMDTEGNILAEIIAQVIDKQGEAKVERHFSMGGTGLVFAALSSHKIDLYPEYTGTLSHTLLKQPALNQWSSLRQAVHKIGFTISPAFGFNNTYALAMRQDHANQLKIKKISDLKQFPQLRAGFSPEFLHIDKGWPGITQQYGLQLTRPVIIEHGLVYEAIRHNKVDLIDIYTTDAKLATLDLRILEDDQSFIPAYEGLILARMDFTQRYPKTWDALTALAGSIQNDTMVQLNRSVEIDKKSFAEVAAQFLAKNTPANAIKSVAPSRLTDFWQQLPKLTREHLLYVVAALLASALFGISLGLLARRTRRMGQLILLISGLLQTIPSLALLCFLIPLFGIGKWSALIALFLYGILPIVRGTYTGLITIDNKYRDVCRILGMRRAQALRLVELPLASIHILNGIKTTAVTNVGTATLAALIGGGGYGTTIITGLALNDLTLILAGSVAAAVLALLVHLCCELLERLVVPKGLRLNS